MIEFIPETHTYLVDGVIVPSVTEILSVRFGHKYDAVSPAVLRRAAAQGTAVHEAIEAYCKTGAESDLPEVRNFKFLQKKYGFTVKGNEQIILITDGETPVAAGRCDLVLEMDGKLGGTDIKRTAALDREYLTYQLNIYRIGYRQTYGAEWDFLRGIHLRENTRRFVEIPINEQAAWEIISEWRKENDK